MKKLVCDRCGRELTEKNDIDLAMEGQNAWEVAAKCQGIETRGVIPCEHFMRCGGEMIIIKERRFLGRRW